MKQKLTSNPEITDESDDDDKEAVRPSEMEQKILNNRSIDPEEFFGAPSYLTVSGQLHLEAMAWYVH